MKFKKILASIIATAMLMSSIGLTAFAEDSAIVAKVGNTEYTDIQEAIKDAAPNGTVEIVKDVVVDEWKQFQQGDSSYQYLIYIDMNGLKINGNNHTLTVNNIISGSNGNRLFSSANNLNISDLTINQPDGLGGISLKSGKIENVTFNSGNGIFPGDGDITIDKCTFKTDGYCIYSEEENNGLKVTNNIIDIDEGKNVIFLRGTTEFTGNEIVSGGKTRVVKGSPIVSGNSFGDAIVKVYNDASAKIENNSITNIEIDDETKPVSATFTGNELSTEAYEKLASIDEELVENNTVIPKAKVYEVADDTELAEAIKTVADGDTIKLAAGNYTGGISVGENITLEGTVDEEGNPTTIFKGNNQINDNGYHQWAIYMNKGIIKNIKLIDAWKGIMTEGTGSLTIDNVTMNNIMYGVHIAEAKNSNDTVTVQNCHLELGWANSFCGGSYTIILKNNEFTSSDPTGVYPVNTFNPNTTVVNNIFGEATQMLIRDSAKDGVDIGPNYYEDGIENALADGCKDVEIKTYYADREMTEIVEAPKGTITYGYVSQNEIWGELTTNAKTSVEIEIYAGETKIAKTTLNNIGGIIDGDVYVTWHNNFVGNFDEYWTTEWYDENPVINVVPTKVVLVADGIAVAENVIKMCGPDNLNPVKWEELEKVVAASLPVAEVKNLGAITFTPNLVVDINKKIKDVEKVPTDLQIAMEFMAKDTPEQAAENPFGEYTTDFFIEISNLSSDSFDATGCYLAGHYGDFEWVQVLLDGMTIEEGKIYPVITSVGFDFSYVDICTSVEDFKCGIYLTDEVLNANPDLEVKLTLGLSKDMDSALAADFITVDETTYVKADFGGKVCNWATNKDAGFYMDGETKYGMIRFLFAADVNGEIEEYGIKYSKASDIAEEVTTDGKTVNASGNESAFYGDLVKISENTDTTYYAAAFIKVDGEYLWSEVASCSPNWENNYTGYTGGIN